MKYKASFPKTFLLIPFLSLMFSGAKPAGDPPAEKPFEYFARPFTAIGVYGGPEASMIIPKGYLSTGIETLRFYTTEKEGGALSMASDYNIANEQQCYENYNLLNDVLKKDQIPKELNPKTGLNKTLKFPNLICLKTK